jgi:hypothetical protein
MICPFIAKKKDRMDACMGERNIYMHVVNRVG